MTHTQLRVAFSREDYPPTALSSPVSCIPITVEKQLSQSRFIFLSLPTPVPLIKAERFRAQSYKITHSKSGI